MIFSRFRITPGMQKAVIVGLAGTNIFPYDQRKTEGSNPSQICWNG